MYVNVLIGVASFVLGAGVATVAAAVIYSIYENKRMDKEIKHLQNLKREIDLFGTPDEDKIDKFNSYSLDCIAVQLELNRNDGFGHLSRSCAAIILRRVAQCMHDNEILSSFEYRIKSQISNECKCYKKGEFKIYEQ